MKANLESLPVDQKTSAPKGGMLSKKIVGMKPRSPIIIKIGSTECLFSPQFIFIISITMIITTIMIIVIIRVMFMIS